MRKSNLFRVLICTLLAGASLSSCDKTFSERDLSPAKEGKIIRVSVNAEIPPLEDAQTGTKVTFSDNKLVWEGNETMSLMFGNSGCGGAGTSSKSLTLTIPKSPDGNFFAGDVEIVDAGGNSFTEDDLLCLSVPGRAVSKNYMYYNSGSSSQRTQLSTDQQQTQQYDGVMNGEYFPLYINVTDEIRAAAKQTDGSYKFDGLSLKWGCSVIRFNVYGTHPSMNAAEVLQNITVNAPNNKLNRGSLMTWNDENLLTSGDHEYRTVTLQNPVTIAGKTADNGVKVFMSIAARNSAKVESIEIETDKAYYRLALGTAITYSEGGAGKRGTVYQYGLNISKFERIPKDHMLYSVDGGATWTNTLPSGTSYTTLSAKQSSGTILDDDLQNIRAWLDTQASAVDLDLSEGTYDSDTFPAVFGNSTAANACTKINSVIFPSNITTIAANAFRNCTELSSVDLTGITTLGNYAFSATGLVSLTVPSSVTSLGTYVFSNTYNLATVYWNCADPVMANTGTSNRKDYYTFQWPNEDLAHTVDLTVYVGSDIVVPRYFLINNNNVVKLVFRESTARKRVGNNAFIRARYLAEIEFEGSDVTKFAYGTGSKGAYAETIGEYVPDANRKIIVPDKAAAEEETEYFWNSTYVWNMMSANLGYTLTQK